MNDRHASDICAELRGEVVGRIDTTTSAANLIETLQRELDKANAANRSLHADDMREEPANVPDYRKMYEAECAGSKSRLERIQSLEQRNNTLSKALMAAADAHSAAMLGLRDLTLLHRRIANIGRLGRGDTDDKLVIEKMVELAKGGVRIGTEHGVMFSPLREAL